MNSICLSLIFILLGLNAVAQINIRDSSSIKEGVVVGEIGGASSTNIRGGKSSFGYNLSVEATPIEG